MRGTGSQGDVEILQQQEKIPIKQEQLNTYLKLREISGISKNWYTDIRKWLNRFLDSVKWNIDKETTLDYINKIRKRYSVTAYRKEVYQIRKFLIYIGLNWAREIQPPPEPYYKPNRVSIDTVNQVLDQFKENPNFKIIKSLILLGISSGMRAHEIYQLKISDIDLDKRTINVNHNPNNGQSTKTKMSRITFLTEEAKNTICEYIVSNDKCCNGNYIFPERKIQKIFANSPMRVKDFRKCFSQEWDRNGGPTSIKKILMGHSIKGDVDLMHYNYQSEEDLKKIYDKVMEIGHLQMQNSY